MFNASDCAAPADNAAPDKTESGASANRKPLVGIALAATAAIAAAIALGPSLWSFFSNGTAVRTWVDAQGPFATVAMAALVAAQIVVAVLPGEPVELAAGYLFGSLEGTVICLVGGLVGTLGVVVLVKTFGMRAVRTFFSEEKLAGISWLRDSRRFELVMFIVFLIPGTPKDVLTYAAGLSTCPWWRIAAITTVGRIPSIVTSTLAAGFASEGDWTAAAITLAVTLVLVGAGAAVYAAIARRSHRP